MALCNSLSLAEGGASPTLDGLRRSFAGSIIVVALVISASLAEGAIIYSDVTDFTVPRGSVYAAETPIDIDGNGLYDFYFRHDQGDLDIIPFGTNSVHAVPALLFGGSATALSLGSFIGEPLQPPFSWVEAYQVTPDPARKVGAGLQSCGVGPAGLETCHLVLGFEPPPFPTWGGCLGRLSGVEEAYIGLQFESAEGMHFGWLRLALPPVFSGGTVRDWAYESEVGVPIMAGEFPMPEELPQISSITALGGGRFFLQFFAEPGVPLILESSTDFITWRHVETMVPDAPHDSLLIAPLPIEKGRLFWRLRPTVCRSTTEITGIYPYQFRSIYNFITGKKLGFSTQIHYAAEPGVTLTLEWSRDLRTWVPDRAFTPETCFGRIEVTVPEGEGQRFWRLRPTVCPPATEIITEITGIYPTSNLHLARGAGEWFDVHYTAEPGVPLILERSSDLRTWVADFKFTPEACFGRFEVAASYRRLFLRLCRRQ